MLLSSMSIVNLLQMVILQRYYTFTKVMIYQIFLHITQNRLELVL